MIHSIQELFGQTLRLVRPAQSPDLALPRRWLRESDLNRRFVVMSHARGLVTAPVIPRNIAEASNSSAAPAYIRPSAIVPALSFEQGVTESRLAESRELASQTLRPHSASNGRRYACPVDSPRWRKAEILPPSGCPPSTLPTRGEPRPLHFPKWRRGAGLDPQCWRT
jgi:hypothetical protein